MLRIQRSSNGGVVFSLSGNIEAADVAELQRLLALETVSSEMALDLRHVTLVARDAVGFLAECAARGIALRNCPGYIREWMDNQRGRGGGGKAD